MAELGSSYFEYRKHKTDFKTEVIAGVTTFLTMAYIMFLNPIILADGGFDFGGVFTATILSIAVACFIMGFYGKTWPIGLAPGMGLNAFVAYGVCLGMGHTPAEALGAVLVAGILFVIISLTPIRAWIINSIPKSLKLGIGAGIGLFLAIIGLEIMGVVADHPVTLVTLGNLKSPIVLLGALAFVVMIVLEKLKVKGNIIIGILVFSAIAWMFGLAEFKGVVGSVPPMTHLFQFDLGAALSASMATVVFTLFFVDFFDTAGTLTSVANVAGKIDSKGRVKDIEKAITESDLGLNPQNDGENIIINIPPLTEERRLILIKQIKNEGEKEKISIRSVRKESNEYIKKLSNDGASEDEIRTGENQIQKITNSYIKKIDNIIGIKEKELITI